MVKEDGGDSRYVATETRMCDPEMKSRLISVLNLDGSFTTYSLPLHDFYILST